MYIYIYTHTYYVGCFLLDVRNARLWIVWVLSSTCFYSEFRDIACISKRVQTNRNQLSGIRNISAALYISRHMSIKCAALYLPSY